MPPGIVLLIGILAIWNPASLALQGSSAVWGIETRSTLSLMFLAARLFITAVGLAAAMALWRRRPGAVGLATLSLALFAIEAVARLSSRADLGSAPPGTRLPLAIFIVAHNGAWYLYLRLSRRVREVYGLESQSQGAFMRRTFSLLIVLGLCAMPNASSAQAPGKTLDIYYIDTEGGQATLYVSPNGQTLLVDAGNSGERDLNRILDVLKVAGVKQLDHFWLTHYHGDHYGSLIDIAKQVPIKHLYDHGPSIEADRPNIIKFQSAYAEFYKGLPRTIVKPGDKLAFAGTDTTTVTSDSVPLKTALAKAPGAGRPNALCADHKPRDESKVDPDNHHSAGFVMNYGRFRTINLGDLTWSREFMLMCPNNPVGTIDLYLTNHHGLDQSGAPAFVHAIQPRVAIMNNGTRKGGAVQTFQTLETAPGLEDIWQLHWSYAGGVEHNTPGVMIANIDERDQLSAVVSGSAAPPAGAGGMAAHAPAHYIKVSARNDGSFTVTNSRNSYSKTYAARPQ